MHPNDVEVIRIYPREAGSQTEDITLRAGQAFELVVEAEVGQTKFNEQGSYNLSIIVRDFSDPADGSKVILNAANAGNFGQAGSTWQNPKQEFVFNVPAGVNAGLVDHILEAHAVLRASAGNPDVSFVRSRLFTTYP